MKSCLSDPRPLAVLPFLFLLACGEPGTFGNLCDQTDQIAFAFEMATHDPSYQARCDNHDFDEDMIPPWADYRDWEMPQPPRSYPDRPDGAIVECRSEYFGQFGTARINGGRRGLEWGPDCRDYWVGELERLCDGYADQEFDLFIEYERQEDPFLEACSEEQIDRYMAWRQGVLL